MDYYYKDAEEARWMGYKYGMTFFSPEDDEFSQETYTFDNVYQAWTCDGQDRVYVHPDSLHLLEPMKGDIVFYSFGFGDHRGEVWDEVKGIIRHDDELYPYAGNGEPYVLTDGGDSFRFGRLTRIIQRSGMAFMWPESEAA